MHKNAQSPSRLEHKFQFLGFSLTFKMRQHRTQPGESHSRIQVLKEKLNNCGSNNKNIDSSWLSKHKMQVPFTPSPTSACLDRKGCCSNFIRSTTRSSKRCNYFLKLWRGVCVYWNALLQKLAQDSLLKNNGRASAHHCLKRYCWWPSFHVSEILEHSCSRQYWPWRGYGFDSI